MEKQPRKKDPAHTPHPEGQRVTSFTDLVIRHTSPKGLETLRQFLLRCPVPQAKEIADKLSAGIRGKSCGRNAGTMP